MSTRFVNSSSHGASDSSRPVPHYVNETFLCLWSDADYPQFHCDALILGTNTPAHLREVHGIKGKDSDLFPCMWEHCNKVVKRESMARHVEEVHMGIVYPCEQCGHTFTRKDTLNKHTKTRH
ncbi:hypothetical protein DEU56DRAFT_757198 [Suillus clintonianus]|uniref:uncharacterized protein n=1 Tax=Suillus clintonianus TaxID=1904413 RepID=UPI001B86F43C|nr:uncharacterized protein DEU56DRAFT_757198 [Suillus clintonianus]KAG2132970.1 hypothetical protein DEU56DRAFT_757198 [Suillus clintonianus]